MSEALTCKVNEANEYDFDSSDEEDIRNTVGNIPLEWYAKYRHIGYDTEGKPLLKPEGTESAIDKFLDSRENPDYWRTVWDPLTGQAVVLSEADVALVKQVSGNKAAGQGDEDLTGDFCSGEVEVMPLSAHPPQKRSFLPSRWERLKVGRMVHAMKMGWMKAPPEREETEAPDYESDEEAAAVEGQMFADIWTASVDGEAGKRLRQFVRPPQESLPGHEVSYNPPPEYLLSKKEERALRQNSSSRPLIPKKHSSLRHVPYWIPLIKDCQERQRDRYMAPRLHKERVQTTPDELLPKIPSLSEMRPYPNRNGLVYKGHESAVQSVSLSPCGLWLASVDEDANVRIWEACSTYCFRSYTLDSQSEGESAVLAWNPNPQLHLLAVAIGTRICIINPGLTDSVKTARTNQLVATWKAEQREAKKADAELMEVDDMEEMGKTKVEEVKASAVWSVQESKEEAKSSRQKELHRIIVKLSKPIQHLAWHARGDYFLTLTREGSNKSRLLVHRVSKLLSQPPFNKLGSESMPHGLFHPRSPLLYLATQRLVNVYDLANRKLVRTLRTGCDCITSMAIHPSGDHLIVGSRDSQFAWFDLDMGQTPFKKLKLGRGSVLGISVHPSRPLVTLAMNDGSAMVLYAKISSDLLEKPVILPVQIIRAHDHSSTLDCECHSRQAYVYTAGADATVRQFVHWN